MAAGITEGAPVAPNEPRRRRFLSRQYLTAAAVAVFALIVIGFVLRYQRGSDRRRYEGALKSVLDRMVTAQEGFYYDSTRYTASLRSLPMVRLPDGVHVQIVNPDPRSWWGIATHDRLPSRQCVVWVGKAPPSLPADARTPEEETKPLCFDDGPLAHPPHT